MELNLSLLFFFFSLSFSPFLHSALARGGLQSYDTFLPPGLENGTYSSHSRRLFVKSPSQKSVDVAQGYMTNSELEAAIMAFGKRCNNISRVYR
ncbi:hypothetical protein TIFTF001_017813 [Ficus carica]|uniref:Uncharacterized protein n=1 Tax=Ficus carica TaxID=3494 RepID=A0AA88AM04_FICCA|nr:hypothetical protein TIFTF001_017813 [Ficus carica]